VGQGSTKVTERRTSDGGWYSCVTTPVNTYCLTTKPTTGALAMPRR
jgi:hypothetical protein